MTLPVGGLKITKSGLAAHPQNLGGFGVQSRTSRIGINGTWCHGSVPTDRHQSVGRTDGCKESRGPGSTPTAKDDHVHQLDNANATITVFGLLYSIVYYIVQLLLYERRTNAAPPPLPSLVQPSKPSMWHRTPVCEYRR